MSFLLTHSGMIIGAEHWGKEPPSHTSALNRAIPNALTNTTIIIAWRAHLHGRGRHVTELIKLLSHIT